MHSKKRCSSRNSGPEKTDILWLHHFVRKNPTHPFLSLSFWAARRGKKNIRPPNVWLSKVSPSWNIQQGCCDLNTDVEKNTYHTAYMKHHETIKNLIMKNGWIICSLMHQNCSASVYNSAFRLQKKFAELTVAPWATKLGSSADGKWCQPGEYSGSWSSLRCPHRLHAAVAISSWLAQPSTNAPWTVPFLLGTLVGKKTIHNSPKKSSTI